MNIPEIPGLVLLALAIFAYAWVARITGPPHVVNAVGWVIVILTFLALISQWLPSH